ncbi:LysE family translocator [Fulvivirga sp. M361]|uniref:LysE family translocator n=1 Tax=Fulvivirga sp. M361 TaxID=2594266 RepID=UPI00117AC2A8|nr:LysE family translocator [Fulvivirga sp. M361]TRX54289.1 LysE family translocator [Fulvivirga sp. M361]
MITIPILENILLFTTAAGLLIIMPGPAVLYIVAKSMERGHKAGVVSVLGISIGGLVHVIAAGFGLSALLVASATAFAILKYLGAFYLIFLGVKKLLEKKRYNQQVLVTHSKTPLSRLFFEGVILNVFNPKTAIFFLAFLPQFISVEKGGVSSQIIFLGFLFIGIAVISDLIYVFLSAKIAGWLKNSPLYGRIHQYISGGIYVLLGLMTFAISQPSGDTNK